MSNNRGPMSNQEMFAYYNMMNNQGGNGMMMNPAMMMMGNNNMQGMPPNMMNMMGNNAKADGTTAPQPNGPGNPEDAPYEKANILHGQIKGVAPLAHEPHVSPTGKQAGGGADSKVPDTKNGPPQASSLQQGNDQANNAKQEEPTAETDKSVTV